MNSQNAIGRRIAPEQEGQVRQEKCAQIGRQEAQLSLLYNSE